jgi:hypothetical protein
MSYDINKVTWRETATTAVVVGRKQGQVKSEMFWHARRCVSEQKGDLVAACKQFLARCAEEEMWMKSPAAGQMQVTELPEIWQQGKSDCKRAMEKGLDLRTFKSYHEMRDAKKKATQSAGKVQRAERPAHEPKAETTVEQALKEGTVVDAKSNQLCPPDLLPLVVLLAPLPELARKRAITRLMQVANSLMTDHRKNMERSNRSQQA